MVQPQKLANGHRLCDTDLSSQLPEKTKAEGLKFKACLSYLMRACLKIKFFEKHRGHVFVE